MKYETELLFTGFFIVLVIGILMPSGNLNSSVIYPLIIFYIAVLCLIEIVKYFIKHPDNIVIQNITRPPVILLIMVILTLLSIYGLIIEIRSSGFFIALVFLWIFCLYHLFFKKAN